MSLYDGQKCPGCNRPFTSADDIVVCPICGAPQHRECYDKNKACVIADRHVDNYTWESEQASADESAGDFNKENEPRPTITCPRCGEKNPGDALNCSRCSLPIQFFHTYNPPQQNQSENPNQRPGESSPFPFGDYNSYLPGFQRFGGVAPEETINDVPVDEVASFVGPNSGYYIPKFHKKAKNKKFAGFNFSSFFLPNFWFFYRKNYFAGLIFILCDLFIRIASLPFVNKFYKAYQNLTSALSANPPNAELADKYTKELYNSEVYMPILYMFIAMVILRVVFGFLANLIYYRKTFSSIRNLKALNLSKEEYMFNLVRKGGVSMMFAFLGFLLPDFIYMLVQVIGGMF